MPAGTESDIARPADSADTEVVGRTAELDAIERFLAGLAGEPAALVLEGAPGIGKTTVWRLALDRARTRGMVVLACRPGEAEVKQAFAALADLLDPVVDDVLPHLPEPQRDALAVALLRAGATGAVPSARAVAAGVLSALRLLAATTPVVLAIDDLQWLDRASAAALAFAVRRVAGHRMGIVGTLRIGAGERTDSLALGDAFQGRIARVRLSPLGLSAVHHVIRMHLGRVFARPILRRIVDASGGNPLFALELARAVQDADARLAPGEPLPVPDQVTELILRRLERLPVRVRRALLFVAAASSPTLTMLRRALGGPVADAALGRALPARLLDVSGEHLRSAHPLIATTVYASAAPEERRDAHRRLAAIVDSPEERARHLALAAAAPDETVARALDAAAALARRRGATDVAGELQEQAARLTPDGGDAASPRRVLAAEHLFHAGDRARAGALLDEVLAGDTADATQARALHLLGKIRGQEDGFAAAIPYFEQALRRATEPSLRVAIEMDRVLAIFSTGDLARAAALAGAALAEAEQLDDGPLIAEALAVRVTGEAALGRGIDWAAIERALALEDRTRSIQTILRPTALAGQLAALEGRFGRTCTAYRELVRWATERGEDGELPFLLVGLARAECWRGNFATAIADADEAILICTQTGNQSMRAVALAHRAAARGLLGDVAGARADLTASKPLADGTGYVQAAMWSLATEAELELSRGDAGAAAHACAPLVALVEATGIAEPFVVHFLPDAIEALIGTGELDRAEALLDAFTARATALDRRWALAGATRCRALLAAARGALDDAIAAAEEAVARWREQEIPCDLGRALLVLGRIRRRRGERRAARDALVHARDLFAERSARLWAERAAEEIGRIPIRRCASPDLTATESRVALLAARGCTNRQVAQTLFMSPKTVQANLTRIYAKLGIRTRAELGARFAERSTGPGSRSAGTAPTRSPGSPRPRP